MPSPWQPPIKPPAPALAPSDPAVITAQMNSIQAPATIDEAKKQGLAVEGQPLVGPLVSAKGDINVPAGSFVITVVKNFWDSPTIKSLRTAVLTAVGLAGGVIVTQVISANGDLSLLNWHTTEKAAIGAAAFSLASGYAAFLKRRDNDPVK